MSGKRIGLAGFSTEDALAIRDALEGCDALCRILRDGGAASSQTLDLVIVRQGKFPGSESAASRLVVGEYEDLCPQLAGLGGPGRQFLLLPASVQELLLRAATVLPAWPRSPAVTQTSPTVVLADDDPSITALLKATLSRQNMTCHVAQDGERALALARELQPNAVVLDVNMPHTDGFSVLSSLRNDPATRNIRVLMLTGCEQEMDVLRGFGLGTDDYVTKPFNPMEVTARVKRLIGMTS